MTIANHRLHCASLLILMALLSACSYAPMKDVRPEPMFIKAAIEPGHEVEVVTDDGRELSFVVEEVENEALVGVDGQRVTFEQIERLAMRSWEEPTHPCGGGEPVGCSIPAVITEMSGFHAEYRDRFHKACMQHDFCYRHGHATYAIDRQSCDAEFWEQMKDECGETTVFDILDTESIRRRAQCQLAADQFYLAVQRYGAEAYRTASSTYCEYEGPPRKTVSRK